MDKCTSALSGSVVIALLFLGMVALGGPSDASQLTTVDRGARSISPENDDPPGFNGTIKVHDGTTEGEPIVANEPHVGCDLHIHGFDFDRSAGGSWWIVAWSPTGDQSSVRWSGTWSTGAGTGDWRTELLTASSSDMVDGRAHFKVFVDQSSAPGGEKAKVFWIACESLALEATPPSIATSPPGGIGNVIAPDLSERPRPAVAVASPVGNVILTAAVAGVETLPRLEAATLPNTSTADPSGQLGLLIAFLTGVALYTVRAGVRRS